MFKKVVAIYREFSIDGRRADELVKEMIYLAEHLGIMDPRLEAAILKAFRTENMVDTEIAKEVFHNRLKRLDQKALGGIDPVLLFKDAGGRNH